MNTAITSTNAAPQLWNTRYGTISALPVDDAIARSLQQYGEWIEQELDLLSTLLMEGQSVVEFGGQYGAHTLWLARAVGVAGQVHVVEPRRLAMQQLCANLALNGLSNVHTHSLWLGRSPGRDELASLLPDIQHGAVGGEQVRIATLDDLALSTLHLLKINLPGTLSATLDGAGETLRRTRPCLYFRSGSQDSAEAEIKQVKDLGYRCWSHLPYLHSARNYAGSAAINLFPGRVHQNVVAAPIESSMDFDELIEL